jgi:hypothetical protein
MSGNGLRSLWFCPAMIGVALWQSGCVRVSTEPIRIEPIYIEITINHKIQRELDDIFGELDAASAATEYSPIDEEEK